MQALVQAQIPGARVAAVIANRPDAAGLAWAAAQGRKLSAACWARCLAENSISFFDTQPASDPAQAVLLIFQKKNYKKRLISRSPTSTPPPHLNCIQAVIKLA